MPWVPPGWVPAGWVPLLDEAAESLVTYSALRDATGAVWYLSAEGLPDGLSAVLVVSQTPPAGTDLTPTQPPWLQIQSPDGTTWYVFPAPTGELVATTTPPGGVGLAFLTGLVLTDAAGDTWRLQVTNAGELIAPAPAPASVVVASETLRPRVTEATAVVVQRTPKSAADTLRPRVTEAPAVVDEGFTLPPGAIRLPLPQGQLITGFRR